MTGAYLSVKLSIVDKSNIDKTTIDKFNIDVSIQKYTDQRRMKEWARKRKQGKSLLI